MSVDSARFTILGASGFIGAALIGWLESHDHVVHAVTRASFPGLLAGRRQAGNIIDCIGLTGDVGIRPLDAAEAHVGLVARGLSELRFDLFLLLSSTRVYVHASATHEAAALPALPADPSDLYNLTKLAGEALCLADPRPEVRVARLSSVYGIGMQADTFLGQLLHQGLQTGRLVFRESAESANDYINLAAIVRVLPAIAAGRRHRLYNVATGTNTSHAGIADCLSAIAGWPACFAHDVPASRYPPIDTGRLAAEFGRISSNIVADLPTLLAFAQECQCSPSMRHMAA